MHFGTNDLWNVQIDPIINSFGRIVNQMRANNPNMKILVAKIIPLNPWGCWSCYNQAIALNDRIPGWAACKSTAQSPITIVDQWSGFVLEADAWDSVHLNADGDAKIANKWFAALSPLV